MKTAIIATGGGMKCSYSVGVMKALVEKYNFKNPDIVIAASGSSGTMSYYVAKQFKEMVSIWSDLLSTKRFINFLRFWRIIDIDYLVDDIFKKQEPLDVNSIAYSKIKYLIPVTNYDTGEVEYLSNKDDTFEAMRATKAMPIAFNKPVKLNGKRYCDSYNSSLVELNFMKALELKAEKILVLTNGEVDTVNQMIFNTWLRFRNKDFINNYRKDLFFKEKFKFPDNVNYLILKPNEELKIGTFSNNKELLRKTIEQGYKEACENKELTRFLT